jgi:hypothetical protein
VTIASTDINTPRSTTTGNQTDHTTVTGWNPIPQIDTSLDNRFDFARPSLPVRITPNHDHPRIDFFQLYTTSSLSGLA